MTRFRLPIVLLLLGGLVLTLSLALTNCARIEEREMVVTAYCGCRQCCSWERGNWKYFKLDFWNRYVSEGAAKGREYSGLTASGTKPNQPHPGLFSVDSLVHPWMIPVRIVFFPWLLLPAKGTIAADTQHFPFGTEIYVPGYGWGIVEDRGGAIKGPSRLDVYLWSHRKGLEWGRQRLTVKVKRD